MKRHATLDQIANEVLASVEQAKTTKVASADGLQTEIGQMMSKLAAELRAANPSDVTYADLAELWSPNAR